MADLGLYVDLSRCIGCYACVVGCKNWHQIGTGERGRIVLCDRMFGEFPEVTRWLFPIMCMQCENPPCISVCRHEATYKREDGIIVIDSDKCVGCELCVAACPYGLRSMKNSSDIVDACDFCSERIDSGLEPYCVTTCPTEALVFGDLDDSRSQINTLIKNNETCRFDPYGTMPKVYYGKMREERNKGGSFSLSRLLAQSMTTCLSAGDETEKKKTPPG